MRVRLDQGALVPTRAHGTDAGLDIRAPYDIDIPWCGWATIHTGVHVELPPGTCGLLVSRSGLNIKNSITSTGLIDEGFQGEIIAKLYNHGFSDYEVKKGDKITQLVVLPVLYPEVDLVDDFEVETERGSDGYGSTGRQ